MPTWRRFIGELLNPLVYLLIGAVIVSLLVWLLEGADGVPFEAIVIAVIIVLTRCSASSRSPRPRKPSLRCSAWRDVTATVRDRWAGTGPRA